MQKDILELVRQTDIVEAADFFTEIDKDVNIAIIPEISSRKQTKQP